MSENFHPKNVMVGLDENQVPARREKLVAIKEIQVNQLKRKPFGARDQNGLGDVGQTEKACKNVQRPASESIDSDIAIKQELPNNEQEFMETLYLGQLQNCVELNLSDDESMEVEIASEDQENIVPFAEKETEYHVDYTIYLLSQQEQNTFKINPRYMSRQKDINFDMRATLIDWLCELREEFKLHNETLFLAVALTDRFLSVMSCSRDKLQLAGVTAMFIAGKYEEVYPPSAQELAHLTDNTYSVNQLLKLEVNMIKVLKYQVATPTACTFLSIFMHSQSQGEDAELRNSTDTDNFTQLEHLAKYICELTLLQGETFLHFLPSEIAAAALYVAADTLGHHQWRQSVFRKSGHAVDSMEKVIKLVHKFYILAPRLQWPAIRDKYALEENSNVAKIRPNPTIIVSSY